MTTETRTASARPALDDAFEQELERMAVEAAQPPLEVASEPGLARYVKFQVKDFLKYRALPIVAISLIALWIFHYNYDYWLAEGLGRRGSPIGPDDEPRIFRSIVSVASLLFGGLGTLISTVGIVAHDREGGRQKFLFAKPVSITRFYLQAFAVNGIGLLLTALFTLLCTSLAFLRPVPIVEPLLAVGSIYAAVGGLVFMLSTLVRFDLAVGMVLAMLAFPMAAMAERGHWWAVVASWVLPPLHKLEAFDPSPGPRTPPMAQAIGSLVAYGAAYLAVGVAALKKRSIMR